MIRYYVFFILSLILLQACSQDSPADAQQNNAGDQDSPRISPADAAITSPVIVYSSRQEHLIKPMFDRFTEETGIEVQYQTGEEGPLIARLQAEGEMTFADMLYTVDAGYLWTAADRGLLAPLESEVLQNNIPAHLRDPQGRWFGLSVRARTIVYARDRVEPSELSSYEALTEPRWQGRLCLRTSKEVYNMSLVATMIERHGEAAAQDIVEGWVANLAAPVFSSDNLVLEAIAAGQCDVGLVNSYYLGRKIAEDPEYPVALFWANQDSSGTHVNISGAGVTRHAQNPQGARRLIEWLSTQEPQEMFSELNLEYPANPEVMPTAIVRDWGSFNQDQINVEAAGRRQAEAVMLMDRADYR
ncbi:MAG: Fe(3+) ABC transporter substrate-binding protein [Gammaproteobacteria bacterium]|nr:Fe(3+) ABC transporter substrate-binding protein [Gammaproteobacteria bacterium]|tara:strand:+ start:309797 stop:310870 length:1074 start_codon:yes stop_codon:yes gene_type:complete